jgi:WD40 repeat protein
MLSPQFCAACGAANEAGHSHCFACSRLLSASTDAPADLDKPLLHERYRIEALLGSGGYSTVYRARDLQAGRDVAIKQINLRGLSAEEAIEATDTFNREASVLSSLHHPQIPRMYDQFNDQDHWYLVLQYLEGPTLETYLETRQAQNKPLQFEEVLRMALQLGKVLNYLHTRQPPVIFRDLKPSNIICKPPRETLCLVDFGIARRFRPGQKRDTQALGSPGYAAPEQYGRAQTTPRSDIYSLGALIHHLLSGQDPAERLPGLVPLRLRAETGEEALSELVQHMLAANPEERPATMGEIIKTLEAIQLRRVVEQGARIWQPPVPQELPPSPVGWQQVQVQVPHSLLTSSAPATRGRRGLSRRKMLVGMRATLLVAAIGGTAWWLGALSRSHSGPAGYSPPFAQKSSSGTISRYLHTAPVNTVTWSPNGRYIASGSNDQTVHVLDVISGELVLIYRGHTDVVTTLAWSPDSKYIVSGSADKTTQVWEATSGILVLTYQGYADVVAAVAWSPNGELIAAASGRASQIWNTSSGKTLLTYSQGETTNVLALAWSPDSKYIVSGSNEYPGDSENVAQVWEAATGKTVLIYRGHTDSVTTVAWSPDGAYIASGSADKTVQVWRTTSNQPIQTLQPGDYVNSVAWSPDGKYIAASSENGTIQIYATTYMSDNTINISDLASYQEDGAVNSIAWSPGGKSIVYGSSDGTVDILNVLP